MIRQLELLGFVCVNTESEYGNMNMPSIIIINMNMRQ